jgi:hypothetical protein
MKCIGIKKILQAESRTFQSCFFWFQPVAQQMKFLSLKKSALLCDLNAAFKAAAKDFKKA